MKRKLIICIPSLRLGGAAKIALNLCEFYTANETEVILILTGGMAGEEVFTSIPEGVKVITVPGRKLNRWVQLLFQIGWLAFYFRKFEADAILAVRHDATVVSSLGWKLAGKPGAFFIREINPITRTLNRKAALIRLLQAAYSSADGVIANSNDVRDALEGKSWMSEERIHVVDNPVLTKTFFEKAASPVEDVWLTEPRVPLVVTIGRLQKMKDHESLIKAFKLVKKKVDCKLMIIGEGEEAASLEMMVDDLGLRESVRLMGGLENPYPYLREADVFVLSSIYEGFGNVLVEALSLGKNVVSTDCTGGPAYILNYGEFGTLVPVGAVEEIAEAIVMNLKAPAEKEKLIRRAREFSVEVSGKRYSEIMFKSA
jgi:glycosyltransferase involved in cell wall biosynthesis